MRSLLVIAGPLSGYLLALYRQVGAAWPCTVRMLHTPLPSRREFAHEQTSFAGLDTLDAARATAWQISCFIRASAPDAVVVHGVQSLRATVLAAALLPRAIPFLYASDTNICDLAATPARLLPRIALYRALFSRIDVTLSLGLTNELAHRLLGAGRIDTLPIYAIDFEALDGARCGGPAPAQEGRKRIAIIARLVPEKNLAAGLRALSDPALVGALQITVAGDGPERGVLEALARDRHLDCTFLGALPREQIGAIIGAADALLLPSIREPWGIVVCEALGLGVPVIATPAVGAAVSMAGQTRAVVLSAGTGEADIAQAMKAFVANASDMARVAQAGAEEVRRRYSLSRVTSDMCRLLSELTERGA